MKHASQYALGLVFGPAFCVATVIAVTHQAAAAVPGQRCLVGDGSLSAKPVPDVVNTDEQHAVGRQADGNCCLTKYSSQLHRRACLAEASDAEQNVSNASQHQGGEASSADSAAPPPASVGTGGGWDHADALYRQAHESFQMGDSARAFNLYSAAASLGDSRAGPNACMIARSDTNIAPTREDADSLCQQIADSFRAALARRAGIQKAEAAAALAQKKAVEMAQSDQAAPADSTDATDFARFMCSLAIDSPDSSLTDDEKARAIANCARKEGARANKKIREGLKARDDKIRREYLNQNPQ